MLNMTASQAKQNFGTLLGLLAQGPVAIQRHQKTVAVVVLPESAPPVADPRIAARAAQQQRELQRLMHHQQWAITLLCAKAPQRRCYLKAAKQVVQRWHAEQLCSADYVEQWRQWLTKPVAELAPLMCGDADGWGQAMRQNSPFASLSPETP